jgi:hypothetical protein
MEKSNNACSLTGTPGIITLDINYQIDQTTPKSESTSRTSQLTLASLFFVRTAK